MTMGLQLARLASQAAQRSSPPPRVVGGDVYPHDVISFVTRHQLEGDEVGGHDSRGLYLKSHVFWLPEQGNPPLVLAGAFVESTLYPDLMQV